MRSRGLLPDFAVGYKALNIWTIFHWCTQVTNKEIDVKCSIPGMRPASTLDASVIVDVSHTIPQHYPQLCACYINFYFKIETLLLFLFNCKKNTYDWHTFVYISHNALLKKKVSLRVGPMCFSNPLRATQTDCSFSWMFKLAFSPYTHILKQVKETEEKNLRKAVQY